MASLREAPSLMCVGSVAGIDTRGWMRRKGEKMESGVEEVSFIRTFR